MQTAAEMFSQPRARVFSPIQKHERQIKTDFTGKYEGVIDGAAAG